VRLNEPFGDTLSWDLIPTEAIRSANLMPGSNPIYGLNTLGGALSLETKTGFSDPGAEVTCWADRSAAGCWTSASAATASAGACSRRAVFRRGGLAAVLPVAHGERVRRDDVPQRGDVGGAGAHRGGLDADRQRPGAAPVAGARSPRDLHAPRSHRQPDVHGGRARRAPAGGVRAPVGGRVLPRQPHRDR
jgi:hypothetical protein